MSIYLLVSVFFIAACGIVYELLAGTISSYLLGDSVYQFSLVIGTFMSSMGLGSFLSRYIDRRLPEWFILTEFLIGVIGGFSSVILFFAFAKIDNYTPFLFLVTITTGTLVGLEIPLALRLLKQFSTLKLVVSNIMTADNVGGLFASIIFPLILVPFLGLIKTSLFFGMINIIVGGLGIYVFRNEIPDKKYYWLAFTSALILLMTCFYFSNAITTFAEESLYKDEIIFASSSPYQRIVVTRGLDVRMFINGSIQFSSKDEYRYHEAMVHPAMATAKRKDTILIIGGGDGLAAREILKYPDVDKIILVDIDPAVTNFAKNNQLMRQINNDALRNPKVHIINQDAWKYLESTSETFDLIFIDLPDPDDLNLSRLYSRTFYRLATHRLNGTGIIVTQATSPLFARKAFWCIERTLASIESPIKHGEFLKTKPYHVYVPSFGEWGFVLASPIEISWENIEINVPTKFLNKETLINMLHFPPDMAPLPVEINTIDSHVIRNYYEQSWKEWHK